MFINQAATLRSNALKRLFFLLLAGYCTNFNKLKTPVQDFNQHNCTTQRQTLHTIDKLRNFNVELETCIK